MRKVLSELSGEIDIKFVTTPKYVDIVDCEYHDIVSCCEVGNPVLLLNRALAWAYEQYFPVL